MSRKSAATRIFAYHEPIVCYKNKSTSFAFRTEYEEKRWDCVMGDKIEDFIVPKRSGRAWKMQAGDLCRIRIIEGSQVGDLNFWNLDDPKERFFSAKTKQFHSTHLKTYDRLWSTLPYLRPMATFVYDTLKDYGVDKDGGSVHDVIGTRCDPYSYKLITGQMPTKGSCHEYLTEAIKPFGLTEMDVHDVWNIFMCTGFTRDTQQYFAKPSPARKGDFIEFIAEMNLLVALSCCPQGDVSIPVGEEVPEEICHPLGVEIFRKKN